MLILILTSSCLSSYPDAHSQWPGDIVNDPGVSQLKILRMVRLLRLLKLLRILRSPCIHFSHDSTSFPHLASISLTTLCFMCSLTIVYLIPSRITICAIGVVTKPSPMCCSRSARIFKRWETSLTISFGTLYLMTFVVMVLVAAHWLACLWYIGH